MELVFRILLCFIFPPIAVFDKGCGAMMLVMLLTTLGWIPGTIVALLLCFNHSGGEK